MRVVVMVLVFWTLVSVAAALALGAFIRAARRAPVVAPTVRAAEPAAPAAVRPAFDPVPTSGRRTAH